MRRLLRGWTLSLPKAGELSRRQRIGGAISAIAMTAFSWWLAQPVHADPATRTVVRIVVTRTYVEIIRSHFSTR